MKLSGHLFWELFPHQELVSNARPLQLSIGFLQDSQGGATAPVQDQDEQEENHLEQFAVWTQHDLSQSDWSEVEIFGVDHTQGVWAEVGH